MDTITTMGRASSVSDSALPTLGIGITRRLTTIYYPGYYHPHPVTYVEQGASAKEPGGWWYYCESSTSYYPYANECPDGWVRVPAEPPPD